MKFPEFSTTLYQLLKDEIALFASTHSNTEFYACALDCNAEYGEVIIAFNSLEHLEHLSNNRSNDEIQRLKAFGHTAPEPIEPDTRTEQFRWGASAWQFHGTQGETGHLNQEAWQQLWEPLSEQIQDYALEDEELNKKLFIQKVAEIVANLIKDGAFNTITKSKNFQLLIAEQESPKDDWIYLPCPT